MLWTLFVEYLVCLMILSGISGARLKSYSQWERDDWTAAVLLENTAAVLLENKHMESLIIAKMARQTQVLSSDIYILYYIYISGKSLSNSVYTWTAVKVASTETGYPSHKLCWNHLILYPRKATSCDPLIAHGFDAKKTLDFRCRASPPSMASIQPSAIWSGNGWRNLWANWGGRWGIAHHHLLIHGG